jgi:hypothetical protein
MSRRSHHGGRRHGRPHRPIERRPPASSALAPGAAADALEVVPPGAPADAVEASELPERPERPAAALDREPLPAFEPAPAGPPPRLPPARPINGEAAFDGPTAQCTAPQLRRFIKSRAYVPMHELRRRFAINGSEDDVTQVDVDTRRIYVGLPEREGRLLGELLRGGDVGFELSLDPVTPIVVGVYPMRPVPRS